MIIRIKRGYEKKQLDSLIGLIKTQGLGAEPIVGTEYTVLAVTGDTSVLDIDRIRAIDIVDGVKRIEEPFKYSGRVNREEDTVVNVSGVKIGGNDFAFIAGPCSVESEKQVIGIAEAVKKAGAKILRGGAFKPRTSPYTFQGIGKEGIEILLKAKKEVGLPIVTEITSVKYLDAYSDVDIIQIGARNMQNYDLLKEVGKTGKPILLKRGFCNTTEEWLMSAEYVMSEGAKNVILCERGIRTFETLTRNTLDLSSIPLLKEITHLPIIADPSHASGVARAVKPLSLAAVGAGVDGLMIEVHNDPENALCDGAQSVKPDLFKDIADTVKKVLPIYGKTLG